MIQNRGLEGDGIVLYQGADNRIYDNTIVDNARFGLWLRDSHANRILSNRLARQGGAYPDSANLFVTGSSDNVIAKNDLSNSEVGLWLIGASRNDVTQNVAMHHSMNIVLMGDSDANRLSNNVASEADRSYSGDSINIGCRDFCPMGAHFPTPPTTGADDNVVQHNTANANARYGIAQAAGNERNIFRANVAEGNGLADFATEP